MDGARMFDSTLKGLDKRIREHGDPVLPPLAIAHQNLPPAEFHIVYPQPHTLHQPQSTTVKQAGHQPVISRQSGKQLRDLLPRQHHRQSLRLLGPLDIGEPWHIHIKHFFIKKKQRTHRLILRIASYVSVYRKMRKKAFDLSFAQISRMLLIMKENELTNPVNVGLLSPDAVMAGANFITDPI